MFRIVENPEFTHTVPVAVPSDGGHREETMRVRFRVIADELADSFDLQDPVGVKDFLRAVIVRIDDLVGGDNKPLDWSVDLRELVLGLPYARLALLRGYMTAVVKTRLGN